MQATKKVDGVSLEPEPPDQLDAPHRVNGCRQSKRRTVWAPDVVPCRKRCMVQHVVRFQTKVEAIVPMKSQRTRKRRVHGECHWTADGIASRTSPLSCGRCSVCGAIQKIPIR